MNSRELAEALLNLPPDKQELPVMCMNEVWLHEITGVREETENEFSTQPDTPPHIRLETG